MKGVTTSSERVYVFGGEGVNYDHLGTKYLNDMWELTVMSDETITTEVGSSGSDRNNKNTTISYRFEWSQLDRRAVAAWPPGRSHFGHTVLQLDIIDSKEYLVVFGGENDQSRGGGGSGCMTFTQRRVLLRSKGSGMAPDDAYMDAAGIVDDKVGCTQLLGDLWLFSNHYRGGGPWIDLTAGSTSAGRRITSRDVGSRVRHQGQDQDRPPSKGVPFDSSRCAGPGARKWPLLITAPITHRVLLFGGYGFKHPDGCTSPDDRATGRRLRADKTLHQYQQQQMEDTLGNERRIRCLNGLYELDVAAAIHKAKQRAMILNGTDSGTNSSSYGADDDDGPWKALSSLKVWLLTVRTPRHTLSMLVY